MARRWVHLAALLLLVLAGLLLDIVLQGRPAVELDIGGRDLGFSEGFSSKEWSDVLPGPHGPETETYRWMGPVGTLHIGTVRSGQNLHLRLRLLSGRPGDSPWPQARLSADGHTLALFALSPLLAEYSFVLPPELMKHGDLVVELEVETFQVQGDHRELGLIMERAQLEVLQDPTGGGLGARLAGLRPVYTLAGLVTALGALALFSGNRPTQHVGGICDPPDRCGCPPGQVHRSKRSHLPLPRIIQGNRPTRLQEPKDPAPRWLFWPAWGLGAGLLGMAGLLAIQRPETILRAGPTLVTMLLLGATVSGGLRLLGPRWRHWAHWLGDHAEGVLLLLFLLSLLLAFAPHIEADGIEYYAYLRSLAFDRDLHFDNELSLDVPFAHVPYSLGAQKTVTGYEPNYASVGPAIVWAPFLPVAHLLALGGNALGLDWTLDGYSEPYVVLICFGSAISALITLLLGYDLLQRLYGRSLSLLANVSALLGTGLFYYAFYKPDFAHALAACAVTLFVYLWMRTRGRRSPRQWFWLGLTAGFMSTLYWIDAIFVLLPLAEALWEGLALLRARRWPELRLLLLGGLLFALAFLLAFSPQMLTWKILFGQWLTVPQEGFATPSSFVPLALLLSPLHGLLPWTPLAALGMVGLLLLAWEKRPWGLYLLLAFGLYFLYNATLRSWHGGGTFGLRRMGNAFPFFLLGVGALLERIRRWRAEAAVLTAFLPTLWSAMVLLRYQAYTIPHYPSELENLTLGEFLLAPGNFPLNRLPDVLELAFFVQWGQRLLNNFRAADLGYGLVLLILFGGISLGLGRLFQRKNLTQRRKDAEAQRKPLSV